MPGIKAIRVVGIHRVVLTDALFASTREIQWGSDLSGDALEQANAAVREHFNGLYLFEIDVDPPDGMVDWELITQPISGQPESNWQVPWDERPTGEGRWAFFLHSVNLKQPLETPIGAIELPTPTPIPTHLSNVEYDLPG